VLTIRTTILRIDSSPAANMAFAIAGVPCFADTFVQGGSSVLRMKFCAKTPRHRKTPNTLAASLPHRDIIAFNTKFANMRNSLTTFILFICGLCFGQKQGNIWYFGDRAGISFNSGTPVALLDGQTTICSSQLHNEGSSTISDSSGSLLFYCNGQTIWKKIIRLCRMGMAC
jgi:hypothetical protein